MDNNFYHEILIYALVVSGSSIGSITFLYYFMVQNKSHHDVGTEFFKFYDNYKFIQLYVIHLCDLQECKTVTDYNLYNNYLFDLYYIESIFDELQDNNRDNDTYIFAKNTSHYDRR